MIRLLSALILLFSSFTCAACAAVTPDDASPREKKTSVDYRMLGYHAQVRGQFQQAILYYERAESFAPNDPGLLNDLGLAYESSGNSDKALNYYLKALALDYKCLPAYANLGYFYESKGKPELAVYYFGERVKYGDPDDPRTLEAQVKLDKILSASPELMKKKLKAEQQDLEKGMLLRAQGKS